MSVICPTVLASDPQDFSTQLEHVAALSERIQIDIMDGEFAAPMSINPAQIWWPDTVTQADIHVMFQRPLEQLETLISLRPHLIILHAESEGDIAGMMQHIQSLGIKAGLALLPDTAVANVRGLIATVDHVLIFSGNLGHFGGEANLNLLSKVAEIRAIKETVEIGWDGGATIDTVADLRDGGIDVVNVGGAIQRASDPSVAYATLAASISE